MKQPPSRLSWQDVFWSTVVITVGWMLAGLTFFVAVLPEESSILEILLLLLGGLAIGAAQWLVTAKRFSANAWWILAYGVGWSAGLWSGFHFGFLAPDPWVMGGAGGLVVGVMQWVTFRQYFKRAGWWVLLSIAISVAGCWIGTWSGVNANDHFSFSQAAAYLVGGVVCGVVNGFLTGVALRWSATAARGARQSP
jgi:hypothetical protein